MAGAAARAATLDTAVTRATAGAAVRTAAFNTGAIRATARTATVATSAIRATARTAALGTAIGAAARAATPIRAVGVLVLAGPFLAVEVGQCLGDGVDGGGYHGGAPHIEQPVQDGLLHGGMAGEHAGLLGQLASGMRVEQKLRAEPAGGGAVTPVGGDAAGDGLADQPRLEQGQHLLAVVGSAQRLGHLGIGQRPQGGPGGLGTVLDQLRQLVQHAPSIEHTYDKNR